MNRQNGYKEFYQDFNNTNNNSNKPKPKRPVLTIVLLVLCLLLFVFNLFLLFVIGSGALKRVGGGDSKLSEIKNQIDKYFLWDVSDEDISDAIYRGLIEGLDDPYSTYYSKKEYSEYLLEQQGNYSGIGAALLKDEETGYVEVSRVYDNSPAMEAGLLSGDLLVSANGSNAVDMDASDFAAEIRGEEGTTVDLVYIRDGKTYEVTIERRTIERPSVEYAMLEDNIGYIEITEFVDNTADEFKAAVEDLEAEGMEAVIYDVRSNPGGLVDSVTDILDYILPEGTVVYMEDKNGKRTDYNSDAKNYLDYPTAVLINENSASSSEIFAGAIRDFDYGTLIGTKTYGKGIVQIILGLSDGSAIKLTYASYFTPKGENIHGKGIEPDIKLEYEYMSEDDEAYDRANDNQIQKAIEILKKEM